MLACPLSATGEFGVSLSYVPTIDFAPYLGGTPGGKSDVARKVAQACIDIGFFILVDHGVDRTLTDRVAASAKAFFALPLAEKMKVARPAPDIPRGYSPVASESVTYGTSGTMTPGDLKEVFDVGSIGVPAGDPYYAGPLAAPHFAPNMWPERPAELRELWTSYYRAMETLGQRLMGVFALGLGIDERFFDDKLDRHISCLTGINYPEQPQKPAPGQLRVGAHSDYTSLTILRAENAPGGLEVATENGEWAPVPLVEDSFIVNVGDLMMRWTNDRWRSTRHRVVNPPRDRAMTSRTSLAFFQQPNYDAVAECLPSCQGRNNPPKYPPITSGDFMRSKFTRQTRFTAVTSFDSSRGDRSPSHI